MPFISTIRGTFGPQSENKGVSSPGLFTELLRQSPSGTTLPTGGTITTGGGYRIHTFTTIGSSTFSFPNPLSVEYLVIAGGGGGGWDVGGGGGAGGYLTGTTTTSGPVSISVGNGGPQAPANVVKAGNGSNSSFGPIIATGGGSAGNWVNPSTPGDNQALRDGSPGGSGGGAGGWQQNATGGSGTPGQGFPGGNVTNPRSGAGGGGAGGAGSNGSPNSPTGIAPGGVGVANSISGSPVTYSTGGRGCGDQVPAPALPGYQPTNNSGNGGTGSVYLVSEGGQPGSSGIVIVRYLY